MKKSLLIALFVAMPLMAQMLALAAKGAATITAAQKAAIARAETPSTDDFNSLKDFFAKK